MLYGHQNFELTPLRIYSGSVLDETRMPDPSETGEENQIIVTFDYATGAICRADNYEKAKIEPAQLLEERDSTATVLYITESEFEGLKKVQADDTICISIEEFGKLNPIGQAHDMFSRIFWSRIYEFFVTFSLIFSNLRKVAFFDQ